MKAHANNFEQHADSFFYGKAGFHNLKGSGNGVVLEVTSINFILVAAIGIAQLLVAIHIIAENIGITTIILSLIQGPVCVFHKLVIGIAGSVFRNKANTHATSQIIGIIKHFHIVNMLHEKIQLLNKVYPADIGKEQDEFIATKARNNRV